MLEQRLDHLQDADFDFRPQTSCLIGGLVMVSTWMRAVHVGKLRRGGICVGEFQPCKRNAGAGKECCKGRPEMGSRTQVVDTCKVAEMSSSALVKRRTLGEGKERFHRMRPHCLCRRSSQAQQHSSTARGSLKNGELYHSRGRAMERQTGREGARVDDSDGDVLWNVACG